jgi:hypothetical protein
MLNLDYTQSKYRELCEALLDSGYATWTIARYLADDNPPRLLVLLRHDIDRRPENALRIARLECTLGIRSTYYVRMTRFAFRPKLIEEISAMGHEIGYHYETLAKTHGDMQKAIAVFKQELEQLRAMTQVQTISMHGSPLSPYDNRSLWQQFDFRQFDLLGETYLSLDYKRMMYFTDTGRTWKGAHNLRDKVDDSSSLSGIQTTDDLILAIRTHRFNQGCIQTHPERWAGNAREWIVSLGMDFATNQMKSLITLLRHDK